MYAVVYSSRKLGTDLRCYRTTKFMECRNKRNGNHDGPVSYTHLTYASYFSKETNLTKTAFSVGIIDTFVAVLAGFIIFPAAFSVGIQDVYKRQVYNVDSSLYAYYQRCQEHLLEPVVLSMSDTLFRMASGQNDQRMQDVYKRQIVYLPDCTFFCPSLRNTRSSAF